MAVTVSALVTRGFGPIGTINTLPTRGFSISTVVAVARPGMEFTAQAATLEYAAIDDRMQYATQPNVMTFAARDEDL